MRCAKKISEGTSRTHLKSLSLHLYEWVQANYQYRDADPDNQHMPYEFQLVLTCSVYFIKTMKTP